MAHPAPGQPGTNVWGDEVDATLALKLDATTAAATYAPAVVMVGAGIDPTGVADSTTAMQAKIDGAPRAALIVFPVGVFTFSALTVTDCKSLKGAGYRTNRDGAGVFGDVNYQYADFFSGTILRSTATSGAAITFGNPYVEEGGTLTGFILIGPGSGTSVGIQIGSSTEPVIAPNIRNVKVCNFATGVQMQNVNEGTFDLAARACITGVLLTDGTNNTDFRMLNLQRCTTGLLMASGGTTPCLGNAFHAPVSQNNGTGFIMNGEANTIYSAYCENNSAFAFDVVSGIENMIVNPQLSTAEGIRIKKAAFNTQILGFSSHVSPIIDNGLGTFILGRTNNLTGPSGNGRSYIDTYNSVASVPIGSDTTAQRPKDPQFNQQYVDTTLGQPIWCKTVAATAQQNVNFTGGGVTTSGTLTITLAGASAFTVAVLAGDTVAQVVAKIAAVDVLGWTLDAGSTYVEFTRWASVTTALMTFAAGGTGLAYAVNLDRNPGAAVWIDATGATV